jgi:SynChlorMet cassette protein ScmD
VQSESDKTPIANRSVLLRQECDGWAILLNPDTGDALALNPTGVFIWKRLDGHNSIRDILKELCEAYCNVPDETGPHLEKFLRDLIEKGFASFET